MGTPIDSCPPSPPGNGGPCRFGDTTSNAVAVSTARGSEFRDTCGPDSVRASMELDDDVPSPTKEDKHKEKLWQLLVKQRLYRHNKDVLSQIEPAERIEMWVKCGLVNKAGEEALKAKDMNTLELLREKASGNQLVEIERMITQLRPRR